MLVLLVGPKGAGKSHIGRVLQERLGVAFLNIELVWMRLKKEAEGRGEGVDMARGLEAVKETVIDGLKAAEHVSVETTGASRDILNGLMSLVPRDSVRIVRVGAQLPTCQRRVADRDPEGREHLATDVEMVAKVHEISGRADIGENVALDNDVALSDDSIVQAVAPLLSPEGV